MELAPWLIVAAIFVGLSKSAAPGASMVSIAIFAAVLPVKESTGTLLLLLLIGDVIAIRMFRRTANRDMLRRLAPAVFPGIILGAVFVHLADAALFTRVIGIIILALVALHLATRDRREQLAGHDAPGAGHAVTISAGAIAGFTSMVANAGGPVMTLYLLRAGLGIHEFLGTSAWFFFLVNLTKLPFSLGLGLLDIDALLLALALAPAILIGALIGRRIIERISKRQFESLVLGLAVIAALKLVL